MYAVGCASVMHSGLPLPDLYIEKRPACFQSGLRISDCMPSVLSVHAMDAFSKQFCIYRTGQGVNVVPFSFVSVMPSFLMPSLLFEGKPPSDKMPSNMALSSAMYRDWLPFSSSFSIHLLNTFNTAAAVLRTYRHKILGLDDLSSSGSF